MNSIHSLNQKEKLKLSLLQGKSSLIMKTSSLQQKSNKQIISCTGEIISRQKIAIKPFMLGRVGNFVNMYVLNTFYVGYGF